MTTSELLLFAPLFVCAVVGCLLVPRLWRGELLGPEVIPPDVDTFSAWVRMVPAACPAFLGFIVLYGVATFLSPEGGVVPTWYAAIVVTYATVMLAILVAIIAFNAPKALVPPARRDEEGLYLRCLQRRLRKRR